MGVAGGRKASVLSLWFEGSFGWHVLRFFPISRTLLLINDLHRAFTLFVPIAIFRTIVALVYTLIYCTQWTKS
ncbi:uncharacterized protein BO95DRAFT_288641 [Aspergillus brunneoviolaceus CBS 621.78]|uniref:Uncharacterized protein n=1 Tax=Aspergillus brunneoviolaceus CBS 621.78 TaxID=1450534 RepID=A0ACD1FV07_9EURO|nr:hypothetical protein BO95DRAFT_288641 [Aspergillus brunneoviolaceus CBS 621.78]RAH40794.1 hypothetical protein BO95DRAFT_288641 [Aspergillus brunneoviolaceus CBS 621.78]